MADIDVEKILSQLKLSEKAAFVAGSDFWHTTAIPRLRIPKLRMSDGPHHVRGARFFNGTPTATIPCGPALGATFNVPLIQDIGILLGDECKAKGVHILLGPSLNCIRNPLGGRSYECFSEDPLVSGLLGAAYCRGLEDGGLIAAPKHYACHDQEQDNLANSIVITERALREIYLLPFMFAIKHGYPGAIMSAQHKINGIHVSENGHLLSEILRKEWGYQGLIMSDWFGVYSVTEALTAGLDLEMPGPTRWRGVALAHAVACNKAPESVLDERVRSLLKTVKRAAKSGIPEDAPEVTLNRPEDRGLLRKSAAESIVLLKNDDDILPLDRMKPTAVIGPNATGVAYRGGKSAHLVPYYVVSPLEGISAQSKGIVSFCQGVYNHKELPMLGPQLKNERGLPGFDMRVFDKPAESFERVCLDHREFLNSSGFFMNYENPNKKLEPFWYIEIEGTFTPEESGLYDFSITVQGTANLYLDGELVVENSTNQTAGTSFFGGGTIEKIGSIQLEGQKTYKALCRWCTKPELVTEVIVSFGPGGIRLGGCKRLDPEEGITAAAKLAGEFEQVVVFVGLTGEWETEGIDRKDFDLPPNTDKMVAAVLAANPKAVVCLQSATPVSMPWVKDTKALLQAWYGGNEHGNAIADVLFGDICPSGKLPMTFPLRLQDTPAFLHRKSERRRLLYGEDIYVGYRYYDTVDMNVLFPFGFGLSYTTFEFSELDFRIDAANNTMVAYVTVSNTGTCAGAEVVQVYIKQKIPTVGRPEKELKGFLKVKLGKCEKKSVEVQMEVKYATGFWDELKNSWVCEKGQYTIFCGNSSRCKFLEKDFQLDETIWWNGL